MPAFSNVLPVVSVLVFVSVILAIEGLREVWQARRGKSAVRLQRRLDLLARPAGADGQRALLKQRKLSALPGLARLLSQSAHAPRLERYLAQSGLDWTVGGLMLGCGACAGAGFALVTFGAGPGWASVAAACALGLLPPALLAWARARRFRKLQLQLPDAMDLITRAMRAGHALPLGIQLLQDEMAEPVAGEFRLVQDVLYDDKGNRIENVKFAPQPSLRQIGLTREDFEDFRNKLPFVLTTEEIPKYNLLYVGAQRVDEIDTYVFDLAPKTIEKGQRYFQGRAWVDAKDLQVVKTCGKTVPETRADNKKKKNVDENLNPKFVTYREQIDGEYWFPTYTMADDILHFRIVLFQNAAFMIGHLGDIPRHHTNAITRENAECRSLLIQRNFGRTKRHRQIRWQIGRDPKPVRVLNHFFDSNLVR